MLSIVSSPEPLFTAAECRGQANTVLEEIPGTPCPGPTRSHCAEECILCALLWCPPSRKRGVLPKMPDVAGVLTQVHALITGSQLNTQHLVFSAKTQN